MTCAELDDRLDALLQGRPAAADVAVLEAHLRQCDACRHRVEDARRLQDEIRLLGAEGPPGTVWDRIAAELRARGAVESKASGAPPATASLPWRWLAVAALLTLVVAASLVALQRSLLTAGTPPATSASQATTTAGPPGTAASPAALVESIEVELDQAARHYERAIAGLEQVANESESPLDPALTATLRENLQIIDAAIDESRQALRVEPESRLAQESLFDAFRRKVTLLQDTIALMNEMRKGNQAGATAIASGLDKG